MQCAFAIDKHSQYAQFFLCGVFSKAPPDINRHDILLMRIDSSIPCIVQ